MALPFGDEAGEVAHPPSGRGESEDVFEAVGIGGKGLHASGDDEGRVARDLALTEQELLSFDLERAQAGAEEVEFLVGECDVAGEVGDEGIVGHFKKWDAYFRNNFLDLLWWIQRANAIF